MAESPAQEECADLCSFLPLLLGEAGDSPGGDGGSEGDRDAPFELLVRKDRGQTDGADRRP